MQHFQSILIVVGLLAIIGVLIHGYLLSRKEKSGTEETVASVDLFAEKTAPVLDESPSDDIISEVRIIRHSVEPEAESIDFSHAVNDDQIEPIAFSETNQESPLEFNTNETDVEAQAFEQLHAEPQIEPPVEVINETFDEPVSVEITSHNDNNFSVDTNTAETEKAEETTSNESEQLDQEQDLFIFNVVAKNDLKLGGHELLQFFLTSGFRFGEMDIFHRHEHSDGTGPVLFSIANMMAPGVFDPENMEQFKSEGVSFFLTAPNKNINIQSSFELMLRAVQQMADEFDCIVLNAGREPMTEAEFIEYNHRLLHHI
jgi:cell division protein ZipA